MKKYILIILLSCISFIIIAQDNGEGRIAPYLMGCDTCASISDTPICTDEFIINYLLADIDSTVCPVTDSSFNYSVFLNIHEEGHVINSNLNSVTEATCVEYFSERLENLSLDLEFNPGENGSPYPHYSKQIKFRYPRFSNHKDSILLDSVYSNPDVSPRWRGCEAMIGNEADKNSCSSSKMLTFMYRTLRYPAEAREKSVQGTVVVQFDIEKDGSISNPRIKNDIGAGCGEASLNVIRAMMDMDTPFIPGRINDQAVKMLYTLPFRFKLQ